MSPLARSTLRHTRYLSVTREWAGAVYLPLAELERRTHELPPPHYEILLVHDSHQSYQALGWLHARGRRARLATPPTDADAQARYRLWEPNAWLQEVLQSAPITSERAASGHAAQALDLGCGSGREAVYLADLGWQVVAVDRLPEALERGRNLQRRYAPDSPPIRWICADLETPDWQPDEAFDLVMLFYFYSRELLRRACSWLKPGGVLLVEAFTTEHRARFGKPASEQRVVRPNELPELLPAELRAAHYSEGWRPNGRHTAQLWAVKFS